MSSMILQRRTSQLVTSLRWHTPRRIAACSHTVDWTTRRSFTTTAAPSTTISNNSTPTADYPSSSSTASSDSTSSSTSPPLPRPTSSALRYLIVSAASLAVGAMLASVSEPLQQLNTLRHSATSLHTLLNTPNPPPTLPATAPAWTAQLAANPAFDYKDVTSVFPTANHLIYDSLRAEKRVQHVYHFISKKDSDTPQQQPEVHVLFELGTALCGHAGIVHGGLTASLIDQISGETAFLSTGPGSFTANLNVNYLKPLIAGRWVEVVGRVVGVEGRKIRVRVEVSEGGGDGVGGEERVVYATGDVLFVRPKWIPEQTSEWKISASTVQQEQQKEKAKQQQQNMLKTG